MTSMTRPIRMAGLVMAGAISLVLALLLAERIIQPGIIDDFGTTALLGLVLLFVLPAMTMIALRHDRLEAVRLAGLADDDRRRETTPSAASEEDAALGDPARAVRHAPHARPPQPAAGRGAEGPVDRGLHREQIASERVAAAD